MLAVFACAAALAYSGSRAIQFWLFPSPDPRTVLASPRIAFYWRSWVSVYAATLAALGALALRRRDPASFDRRLPALVVATIVLTTLQGVFAP